MKCLLNSLRHLNTHEKIAQGGRKQKKVNEAILSQLKKMVDIY